MSDNSKVSDLISRADAIEAVMKHKMPFTIQQEVAREIDALPSAEAEPKWNCTANFVAEQLDRLRNMTDEERLDFLKRFFSPSAEAVDVAHDIPEYCSWSQTYTNMVQSAMSKASADTEQGFRGGKIPPKEMLDGTVLIPKHQWLEMERELAELKEKLESAEAVQGEWEHWGSPFSDESEVIDTIVCSVCGARFIEPKDEPKGECNYCPNCGARMKGGAE